MTDNLTLNMDAYLPLRDVVFNTLREAILPAPYTIIFLSETSTNSGKFLAMSLSP